MEKLNWMCRNMGHYYQPRYSYGEATIGGFSMTNTTAREVAAIRNAGRAQTYHYDICERCGDIVKRSHQA